MSKQRRRFLAVTVGMVSFIASSIVSLLLVLPITKNPSRLSIWNCCTTNRNSVAIFSPLCSPPKSWQPKKYGAVLLRGIWKVSHHTKKWFAGGRSPIDHNWYGSKIMHYEQGRWSQAGVHCSVHGSWLRKRHAICRWGYQSPHADAGTMLVCLHLSLVKRLCSLGSSSLETLLERCPAVPSKMLQFGSARNLLEFSGSAVAGMHQFIYSQSRRLKIRCSFLTFTTYYVIYMCIHIPCIAVSDKWNDRYNVCWRIQKQSSQPWHQPIKHFSLDLPLRSSTSKLLASRQDTSKYR